MGSLEITDWWYVFMQETKLRTPVDLFFVRVFCKVLKKFYDLVNIFLKNYFQIDAEHRSLILIRIIFFFSYWQFSYIFHYIQPQFAQWKKNLLAINVTLTIIRTGITCKTIPCYIFDSACRYKCLTYFEVMLKVFELSCV